MFTVHRLQHVKIQKKKYHGMYILIIIVMISNVLCNLHHVSNKLYYTAITTEPFAFEFAHLGKKVKYKMTWIPFLEGMMVVINIE